MDVNTILNEMSKCLATLLIVVVFVLFVMTILEGVTPICALQTFKEAMSG